MALEQAKEVDFSLTRFCPDGSREIQQYRDRVTAVRGGGFFGEVILFEQLQLVLKTGEPDDGHKFWRMANWGARPFPSQVSELQAQLDHLSGTIMHEVVPPYTGGEFYVPASYGYGYFDGGFAQGIERLYGRPPRYDNHANEFLQFRQAQAELTEVAYQLGLEQVGQIHKDNLYAMDNLRLDERRKRWDWQDTLPAIPHKGLVLPFYNFGFHWAIRKHFYPETGELTFNRIHTDMLLREIEKQRELFGDERLRRIHQYAELYDQLMLERQREPMSERDLKSMLSAGWRGLGDLSRSAVTEAAESIAAPVRLVFDPNYRNRMILVGVNKAHEFGMISKAEFEAVQKGLEDLSKEKGSRRFFARITTGLTYGALLGYYFGSGSFLKTLEISTYTALGVTDLMDRVVKLDLTPLALQENWVERVLTLLSIFAGFRILGGAQSYLVTKAVGFLTGRNLETAARISVVPLVGPFLAVPGQICVDAASKGGELIWHYAVRNMIAKLSKALIFNPAGGWGTESEGRLWGRMGKWLEGWVR